jgi:p-hydroxybenzoate 3-monooxygenase
VIATQVGIVGAGPAGLVLAHLLERAGIDSVVLEGKDRCYVEARIRAGVLEHGTVALLDELGLADRLRREGLVHRGVVLQFDGERHRVDFAALTGKSITVYGQQELLKDLIAARLAHGGPLLFEAAASGLSGLDGLPGEGQAVVRFDRGGQADELRCDLVAGCDGFHGVSRAAASAGRLRLYQRDYPFAWLGILASVAPSTDELIYSFHPRGFALHSLRSPNVTRLYLQVAPDTELASWPDGRIWDELQVRLASPGWTLQEGPIIDKGVSPMRSFVVEPMSWGRMFLAGDAAHIVPPTGAKGLNLAVADVVVLAEAVVAWYRRGDSSGLTRYSERCLGRVWRVQDFSTAMTTLMHVDPDYDDFDRRVQRARQAYLVRSSAMSASLAENYVGLPLDWGRERAITPAPR